MIGYTQGEYVTDLLKGRSDPEATHAHVQRVTELTGLDPEFVKFSGGRLETGAYLREVFRDQGQDRLGVRLECDLVRSISVCARPALQRPDPREHHCSANHGNGELRHHAQWDGRSTPATTRSTTR